MEIKNCNAVKQILVQFVKLVPTVTLLILVCSNVQNLTGSPRGTCNVNMYYIAIFKLVEVHINILPGMFRLLFMPLYTMSFTHSLVEKTTMFNIEGALRHDKHHWWDQRNASRTSNICDYIDMSKMCNHSEQGFTIMRSMYLLTVSLRYAYWDNQLLRLRIHLNQFDKKS